MDPRPAATVVVDPPGLDELPEIAHWVAPSFLEVRFDARFFAVAAPSDIRAHPDGVEVERVWWARPEEVLDASGGGAVSLMWPTLETLHRLAACRSVEEALALRVEQVATGADPAVRGAWRRPEWGTAG